VRPSPRAAEVDGAGGGASCGMNRGAAMGAEEWEGGGLAVTANKAVGKALAAVEEDASSLSWVLCSSPVALAILKAAHRMQDYVTVARLACTCRALRETVREHADVLSSYSVQGEVLLNDRFGINGAVQPGKAGGYLLAAMDETRITLSKGKSFFWAALDMLRRISCTLMPSRTACMKFLHDVTKDGRL